MTSAISLEKAAPVVPSEMPHENERSHDYYLRMIREAREEHRAKGHMLEGDPEDMVNSPPHYNQAGIECIDAIEAALGVEGFRSYCQGNVLKYVWRYQYKGGQQDLEKALWYLTKMTGTFSGSLHVVGSDHNCT